MMEKYLQSYSKLNTNIIYSFNYGQGGLGDYIKFFTLAIQLSIKNNEKIYYLKNNLPIEKYLPLKYDKMYISKESMKKLDEYKMVDPSDYYKHFGEFGSPHFKNSYDKIYLPIKDVFEFSAEVISHSISLLPKNVYTYNSIHLRCGDNYIKNHEIYENNSRDCRWNSKHSIKLKYFLRKNKKPFIFFTDNIQFKNDIKKKFNNLITLNVDIHHTGFEIKDKELLDSIAEFYVLSNSKKIIMIVESGFARMAARINNIPIETLF
jgi:hypothetical protein